MGRYNIDSENKENALVSTPGCSTYQQVNEHDLERELSLTAMVFCSSDYDVDLAMTCNDDEIDITAQSNLQTHIESEDMMYFAGYLANKFPQYELGVKFQEGQEANWISTVVRRSHKLTKPNAEFIQKMEIMVYFDRFHEQTLQSGKGIINTLSTDMKQYVDLPDEVIAALC